MELIAELIALWVNEEINTEYSKASKLLLYFDF